MMYSVKQFAKYLLGIDIAGRNLTVYPDDTFLVSYPRSGNTWTRFLIANLIYPQHHIGFADIERFIPDAEAHSNRYLRKIPSPRLIKSHQYFDHRYPRVIYIVRDPRDVVVSYYDFSRKYRHIPDAYPMERYVEDFVHARLNSASWGTWAENVGTWVAARQGHPNFLLLRYEDMLGDAAAGLAQVARFLAVEPTPERIRHAVEGSSASKMRELEQTEGKQWVSTKNKRDDIPFIGTAKSGKWRTKLSASAARQIEEAWGPLLTHLGYELTSSSVKSSLKASPFPFATSRF